jgi:hypothetical protein
MARTACLVCVISIVSGSVLLSVILLSVTLGRKNAIAKTHRTIVRVNEPSYDKMSLKLVTGYF